MLPKKKPELNFIWHEFDFSCVQFGRSYCLSYLPTNLFSRLMIRLMRFNVHQYWRHGIVLSQNSNWALVECVPDERSISLTARGTPERLDATSFSSSLSQMLRTIVEIIDGLLNSWPSLTVTRLVPCVHCIASKVNPPNVFSMDRCELAVAQGLLFMVCKPAAKIDLTPLDLTEEELAGALEKDNKEELREGDVVTHRVRIDQLIPDISLMDVDPSYHINHDDLLISSILGQGSVSVIKKANWNDQEVAVKEYNLKANADEFSNFRREVWLLSGLDHPNIIRLKGFTLSPHCLVMEYLELGDLYRFLHTDSNEKLLTWAFRLRIAIDVSKALQYLHLLKPPILHRDVKSPNILLFSLNENNSTVAKLSDFGLASLLINPDMQDKPKSRCVINPTWVAPEILRGSQYSAKSDVYAFGLVLHEILTREHPFEEFGFLFMSKLEDSIVNGVRPTIPPNCPSEFAALIASCWQDDPQNRPTSTETTTLLIDLISRLAPNLLASPAFSHIIKLETKQSPLLQGTTKIAGLQGVFVMKQSCETDPSRPKPKIDSLIQVGNYVWCVNDKTATIYVWNLTSGAFLEKHESLHPGLSSIAAVNSSSVWTGAKDGSICVWRVEEKRRKEKVNISKSGYLDKLGEVVKNWRRRWFVLDHQKFTYYKSSHTTVEAGTINLAGASIAPATYHQRSSCIAITTKLRIYIIDTGSPIIMREWLTAIGHVIENFDNEKKPPSYLEIDKIYDLHQEHGVGMLKAVGTDIWSSSFKEEVYIWDTNPAANPIVDKPYCRKTVSCKSSSSLTISNSRKSIGAILAVADQVWIASSDVILIIAKDALIKRDEIHAHDAIIHDLVVSETQPGIRTIWSCGEDAFIRVWDFQTHSLLQIIPSGSPSVLASVGGEIWSAGKERKIKVIDAKKYAISKELLTRHDSRITAILVCNRNIWSGASDGTICIWA